MRHFGIVALVVAGICCVWTPPAHAFGHHRRCGCGGGDYYGGCGSGCACARPDAVAPPAAVLSVTHRPAVAAAAVPSATLQTAVAAATAWATAVTAAPIPPAPGTAMEVRPPRTDSRRRCRHPPEMPTMPNSPSATGAWRDRHAEPADAAARAVDLTLGLGRVTGKTDRGADVRDCFRQRDDRTTVM